MEYSKITGIYKATMEKVKTKVIADTAAMLNSHEEDKKHFGDEHAAKIRKHDGSVYYYVSEQAMMEMLTWKQLQEAALTCLVNSRQIKELSKNEYTLVEYLVNCRVDETIFKSLKKALKGAFLADFYYNKEQKQLENDIEEAKTKLLTERWGF